MVISTVSFIGARLIFNMQQMKPKWWGKMPFVRLLLPLIIGIILQFHFQFHPYYTSIFFISSLSGLAAYAWLPLSIKFRF
ncbi:MAG: hypothetical protein ACXWB9_08280, partial [Flavisolibacter sp.]